MSQTAYRIDLRTIGGEGEFPCPHCGSNISPDDKTDDNYTVLQTSSEDGNLIELEVICKKCESTIRIVGFASGLYSI